MVPRWNNIKKSERALLASLFEVLGIPLGSVSTAQGFQVTTMYAHP